MSILILSFCTNEKIVLKEKTKNLIELPSGVSYSDIKVGDGPEIKNLPLVKANYILYLSNGVELQNSKKMKVTLDLKYGEGSFIRGFLEGVAGMKKGGERKIFVPSELGYGGDRNGNIPPGSDLIFVVSIKND